MRYTIRHTFDVDLDTFWNQLFFDPEYNRALFIGHLGFARYAQLALDKGADGSVHRRTECAPKVELPAAAKKIVGDSTAYVEDGRFDPKTKRFQITVTPKVGSDMVQTRITMWAEARGEKRIERIVEVDNTIKVFGVGKVLELFVEKQMRANYDAAAEFTRRWIRDKGL